MTQQLKEPEIDLEGEESHVEVIEGSDVVISNQLKLKGEKRKKKRNSRFAKKKLQELIEVSRFNPKLFEKVMSPKRAKQLVRYKNAKYRGTTGV